MPNRYAPLPDADDGADRELEAAFDESDDDDEPVARAETRPLARPAAPRPGGYDFENVDYDYPPPGSPPGPSTTALPNSWGNSNGRVPDLHAAVPPPRRAGWLHRTAAAVLPSAIAHRIGASPALPAGAVGGGGGNDGVFANVTAKPTAPIRIQDGDETYVVPEDTRAEAPPSYAAAQADSVPPYWETTVHAPFSSDSIGEMIIDSLPTGSVFSFLWNMLISISFQFVGFLLTYLLHTTHAARFGSRAGLGITLIQYGFALRNKIDSQTEDDWKDSWRSGSHAHPFPTAAEGNPGLGQNGSNSTAPSLAEKQAMMDEQASILIADATTEWLSFFLMTVGWFILLTSLLGFWRVKRWERGIVNSQGPSSAQPSQPQASEQRAFMSRIEQAFTLNGSSADTLRAGLGFRTNRDRAEEAEARALARVEAGEAEDDAEPTELDLMIPLDPNDPNREEAIRLALANERRLHDDLRAAGLL